MAWVHGGVPYIYIYIYLCVCAAQRLVGPGPKPGVALVGLGTQDLAIKGKILLRIRVASGMAGVRKLNAPFGVRAFVLGCTRWAAGLERLAFRISSLRKMHDF